MNLDLVVVGAGLTGSVIAERAACVLSWRVLVVEQRGHVAGNAHDSLDQHGVLVHRYGPHVFHTNSESVWGYLSKFTDWRPYVHQVYAWVGDQFVPLPINLTSLFRLFPPGEARSISEVLLEAYGCGASVPILRLRESPDPRVRNAAACIYEQVYAGYTMKQWGMRPDQLDASVTGRVPIRINHDGRYFTDRFQGVPRHGYTAMVSRMLTHPNIEVRLDTDFHDVAGELRYRRLVYTGSVDRFFDYGHGELPYRSVRFDFQHYEKGQIQPAGVVTYPNERPYTRCCEFKVLTGQVASGTTLSYEYPQPHVPGTTTPYYPVPMPETRRRYQRYAEDAAALGHITFCGRLGSYQYLNMDQAVAQALHTFRRLRDDR